MRLKTTFSDWTRCWLDGDGRRHRVGGPAFEGSDGTKEWCSYGTRIRYDHESGYRAWYDERGFFLRVVREERP